MGLTLGGLGNTLDGALGQAPSYAPPQAPASRLQAVKLPNGKTVLIPVQTPAQAGKGGGLVDVGGLLGGLGLGSLPLQQTLSLSRLPLGRK